MNFIIRSAHRSGAPVAAGRTGGDRSGASVAARACNLEVKKMFLNFLFKGVV